MKQGIISKIIHQVGVYVIKELILLDPDYIEITHYIIINGRGVINNSVMQREKGWCSGVPTLYTNVAQFQLLEVKPYYGEYCLLLTLSLGLKGFTHGSLSSKQTLLNSSAIR